MDCTVYENQVYGGQAVMAEIETAVQSCPYEKNSNEEYEKQKFIFLAFGKLKK